MSLADNFAALAIKLLDKFGSDGVLVSSGPTVEHFDKLLGEVVGTAETVERPVRAVVAPIEVLGTEGRKVLKTLATMLVEPRKGDVLKLAGNDYTLGDYTVISVQGLPVIYRAEVS